MHFPSNQDGSIIWGILRISSAFTTSSHLLYLRFPKITGMSIKCVKIIFFNCICAKETREGEEHGTLSLGSWLVSKAYSEREEGGHSRWKGGRALSPNKEQSKSVFQERGPG